jgi:hypothetical protein
MSDKKWFWLSFSDDDGKFMGVMVVFAENPDAALRAAEQRDAETAKFETNGHEVPWEWGQPPIPVAARLLTKAEALELSAAWDPQKRGLAGDRQLNAELRDPVVGGPLLKRPE